MKKNVIGNLIAPKQREKSFFKRWDVLPRILCLVLALIVWLLVVNFQAPAASEQSENSVEITDAV